MFDASARVRSLDRDFVLISLLSLVCLAMLVATWPAGAQPGRTPPGLDLDSGLRRLEQFGVRHEAALGTPSCTAADVAGQAEHCTTGPWLETRSPRFVNIKKTAYMRGRFDTPNGIQLVSSFVAQQDGTDVAIVFSAEAFVADSSLLNRRMFVRALVDGQVVAPSNVVFATGLSPTPRSFVFAARVDKGIHTVEIQWMVDRGARGFMRDATLLVRTGVRHPPRDGTLVASAAPSGPTVQHSANAWVDVPGLGSWVFVPPNGVLTMTMSAESFVTSSDDTKRMFVRALVDGAPASPGNVVFARGSSPQSRAFTFGRTGLMPGWHFVAFQWLVDDGATGHLGDRAQMLAAYPSVPSEPAHRFVSPASGPSQTTESQSFEPLFLETTITVGPKGNGEVAAIFSGEAMSTSGSTLEIALAIDEVIDTSSIVAIADGSGLGEAKTFTFAAKQLPPGVHNVGIYWRVQGPAEATGTLGDRSLAVASETGFIPDLAEPLPFAPARYPNDNQVGLVPTIGTRNVLAILWDPHRPDHGEPDEPDQSDIPAATVHSALYGAIDSADDYFREVSGGRFRLANAGVLGWFDNASVIWESVNEPLPFCINGYKNRHIAKRADALLQADEVFDFSQYDRNEDGVLDRDELAIVMVIPQSVGFGTAHVQVNDADCDVPPLTLDGVRIPLIAEWYTSVRPGDFIVAAHELAHLALGLDDIYLVPSVTGARRMSLMSVAVDGAYTDTITPHLDAMHKLALGWVTPEIVARDGVHALMDVKLGDKVLVLPRYRTDRLPPALGLRGEEYFLLENRQQNLPGLYDEDLLESGIAVWHVVSDPVDNALSPRGITDAEWQDMDQTQARRGLRLLKRFTSYDASTGEATASKQLWDPFGSDLLSGKCDGAFPDNVASWADCSASGYSLRFLTPPANSMLLRIDVP